jgi:hypothetical protein
MVTIEVLDRNGNPRVNYSVSVEWSSGRSNGHTDNNGMYNTGVSSGTIKSITVAGRNVYSSAGRRVSGETVSVTYS